MRIMKNNLAYPLLRDIFALLGSSKCEVMSVLDLKDTFHSLWLSEKSPKYCGPVILYLGPQLPILKGLTHIVEPPVAVLGT